MTLVNYLFCAHTHTCTHTKIYATNCNDIQSPYQTSNPGVNLTISPKIDFICVHLKIELNECI